MRAYGKSRLGENASTNNVSSSDSVSSTERGGRPSSLLTVTEEHKNGVRLRVRFASKDQGKCQSADDLDSCPSDAAVPYDILNESQESNLKVSLYKCSPQQQL